MGNSSSSLPYSIDNQVGAPQDHHGWALHHGKSTADGSPVTVFVGKKPVLSKTPVNRHVSSSQMQLVPALHHYNHCRKLRHPSILKVYATLDTDNPAASAEQGANAAAAAAPSSATTGDLIIVTEPCIPLQQWLLEKKPTAAQLAWGLECVVKGLHFLHASANMAHGAIHGGSLYVTLSGDVKLWNFSLVTPVGPNGHGPTIHFQQWEKACCPDSYRSPERQQNAWNAIENAGVHAMDSYSLGILIAEDLYHGGVPAALQKAVQRMQTPNIKMRPRLQPLLKCPVFDTPYQKMQLQLEEITIQPVEQKVQLWQQLGQQLQSGSMPKDVCLYKILPLVIQSLQTICNNESMLQQDMYRREGKTRINLWLV